MLAFDLERIHTLAEDRKVEADQNFHLMIRW